MSAKNGFTATGMIVAVVLTVSHPSAHMLKISRAALMLWIVIVLTGCSALRPSATPHNRLSFDNISDATVRVLLEVDGQQFSLGVLPPRMAMRLKLPALAFVDPELPVTVQVVVLRTPLAVRGASAMEHAVSSSPYSPVELLRGSWMFNGSGIVRGGPR